MLSTPTFDTRPAPQTSAETAGLASYLQSLEGLFVDVRGRGVHWSPTDGTLATAWFYGGVELATIQRVLTESARAWRYTHGEAALPQTLSWIEAAVARAMGQQGRIWREGAAATGTGPQEPRHTYDETQSAENLVEATEHTLTGLQHKGARLADAHPDPAVQHAMRRAAERLGRWRRRQPSGDLLDHLERLRRELVEAVLIGVGPSAATAIRANAERQLPTGLRGRTRGAMLRHAIAEELDRTCEVALPYWEGWRRPSLAEADTTALDTRPRDVTTGLVTTRETSQP